MIAATTERDSVPWSRLAVSRLRLELVGFVRQRESMVFTFGLPIMLLVLFASVFSDTIGDTDVSFRQYFIAGIIGSTVLSTAFQTLAIGIAIEQDNGVVKRLAGSPLPVSAYVFGKLAMVVVVSVVQTVLMLAIAVLAYGLKLPDTAGRWLTLVWVFVLGLASCSLLGIAYTRLIRSPSSASALTAPPVLALQFISGVFFPFDQLPGVLQQIAAIFPMRWMTLGLRSVFLPDSFERAEPGGGSWHHGLTALVLGAWAVGSLLVAVRVFRWRVRE